MTRELAQRENDGIVVTLLWHGRTGRLTLSVRDCRTHEDLELEVEPDRALDAFQHPYAYASRPQPRTTAARQSAYV